MKMKARSIIAAVLFLLGGATACAEQVESDTPVIIESANGNHAFTVELALTDEDRAKGLMYRTELAPDRGMLFVFEDSAPRAFWMRNTLIPLDMIFIRADGRVLNIVKRARPKNDTPRQSVGNAVAVLEIAGGRADELGIKAGDHISHPLIDSWQAE
jgi:uncharacterized membrane protein (UPF0127 family)